VNTDTACISGGGTCGTTDGSGVDVVNPVYSHYLFGLGAAVASHATDIVPTGRAFHVTGTATVMTIATNVNQKGLVITLIADAAFTITDDSNLKLNGDWTPDADDTLTLLSDGTNWFETARSPN